jgi:phosphate binding protein
MKTRFLTILVVIIALFSVSVAFAQDQTIADTLSAQAGAGEFTTLLNAVQAADPAVLEALSGDGELTVFAPTDAAFTELPQVIVDYLMTHPDLLTQVLMYHVVEGRIASADVTDMTAVASMDMGNELTLSATEDGIAVNQANVDTSMADIEASNGVIHAIDSVLLPPMELPDVDPLAVIDNIVVAGSSTVFPLTERIADLFNQDGFAGTVTVDSVGTGAGFERFCVNTETDISNASRPIRPEEVEACRANGLEPLGFFVAIDALAITVSAENDFVDSLTLEQLAQIYSGEAATWSDLNPEWPDEAIRLFSPGSDSGTYDYFVEAIFDEDEAPIQNAPGIQFSEDDNVLVLGVEGSPYAVAYFGYAYFQENQDLLRAVPIEGVTPSEETGITGEYPLSRPLFIYSAPTVLTQKPQVAAFINYYLQNANSQLGPESDQIGYIPTGEYVGRMNAWLFAAANSMGGM